MKFLNCRRTRKKRVCLKFSYLKFQLISEIRSLSADCLPSLLDASVCGVSASQLFGRSVANFFNPLRIIVKKHEDNLVLNMVRDETSLQFFFKKLPVDWNGRYETPAGKAWPRETPQASAEEAPGPPAESECLEWKSTFRITNLQKNVRVNFRSRSLTARLSAKLHQSKNRPRKASF